jgi:hypothetical protein
MAKIARVRMHWIGLPTGPGFSVFHFRDFSTAPTTEPVTQDAFDRVDNFAADIHTLLPASISVQADPTVDILEDTTATLLGSHTAAGASAHTGSGPLGSYAAMAGAVITWRTNDVRGGHRVRGRTFIVPLSAGEYDNVGTLDSAAITTLASAAGNMLNASSYSCDLAVYSRPTPPAGSDGQAYPATAWTIPDIAAILRSRRN